MDVKLEYINMEFIKQVIWETIMECTAHTGWTDRARLGLVEQTQEAVHYAIKNPHLGKVKNDHAES